MSQCRKLIYNAQIFLQGKTNSAGSTFSVGDTIQAILQLVV
jgi:hypothetical protein